MQRILLITATTLLLAALACAGAIEQNHRDFETRTAALATE
jgi:hypothetical protein